jgi:hemerythrin
MEAPPVIDFQWTDTHELGHAEIDRQHMQMFLLTEAVIESLVEYGFKRVEVGVTQLQTLIDFTEEHFAFEEDLMRSASFPGAEWHGKYHASLLVELRTYCGKVQRGQIVNAVGLISFLWNWLRLHIDSEDRELVVWLSQILGQKTNADGWCNVA